MLHNEVDLLIETINKHKMLAKKDKKKLVNHCYRIKAAINAVESVHHPDVLEKMELMSKLETFETKHPMVVSCIDLIARTFSRLGV